MTIRQLGIFGDSIPYGRYLGFSTADGGPGGFMELVAESLADIPGFGPLMSPGFQTVADTTLWTFTGGWPSTAATDAHDVFPRFGIVAASGATTIAKYTIPTRWRSPVVGWVVSICDYASSGNIRYRLDGGAWVNIGQTLTHDNKILDLYIAGTTFSTIEFQAYDGAAGAGVCLGGVTPFFIDPTAPGADGFILQNYAFNGMLLNDLFASTSGDRMAIVGDTKVKYGTGSPPSRVCNLGNLGMFGANDVAGLNNTTTWGTDLTSFVNRGSPLGPVGWITQYETATTTTDQAAYRAKTNVVLPALGVPILDLFTAWQLDGFGAQSAQAIGAQAAGLLSDFTHPTQRGHLDLYPRVYWWLRRTLLASRIDANVNAYAVGRSTLGGTDTFGGRAAAIITGIGAIAAGGALAATGKVIIPGVGSVAGGGALVATGVKTVRGVGTLAGGGTLAGVGKDVIPGTGALIGGGVLVATGVKTVAGHGALVGDSGARLHAAGVKTVAGVGAVSGGGTLAAVGSDVIPGTGAVTGGGTLAATGLRIINGSGTIAGGGTLSATGTRVVAGTAAIVAGGTLAATGTAIVEGSGALIGGGVLAGTGVGISPGAGAGSINGGGTLSAVGITVIPGTGAANGGGVLHATGTRIVIGTASLAGGGTLTGAGKKQVAGTGIVNGGGALNGHGNGVIPGIATIIGGGSLSGATTVTVHATGALLAGGTLAAHGTVTHISTGTPASGTLTRAADLHASIIQPTDLRAVTRRDRDLHATLTGGT